MKLSESILPTDSDEDTLFNVPFPGDNICMVDHHGLFLYPSCETQVLQHHAYHWRPHCSGHAQRVQSLDSKQSLGDCGVFYAGPSDHYKAERFIYYKVVVLVTVFDIERDLNKAKPATVFKALQTRGVIPTLHWLAE